MSTSVLALATTFHFAILVLLRHRSGAAGPAVLLPSLVLAATPWILPAPVWLVSAVALHAGWYVASGRLFPRKATAPPAGAPSPKRPPATAAPVAAGAVPVPAPAVLAKTTPRRDFEPVPVLAVLDEAREIRTFRLLRPEGFSFQAGQFVMVRVQVDGKAVVRCYSISSAPESSGYLEISVKRQGVVSRTLHGSVRPGSVVAVKGPGGAFTYPAGDERPLVLVAGGVGITPLVSMLRHAVVADPTRPVTLLYSVRDAEDVAFADELRVLSRRHPQVRVAVTFTGTAPQGALSGRIDGRLLARTVADPVDSVYCICGPLPMIEGTKALLASLGVPAAQVRAEAFEAAVASATMAPTRPAAPAPSPVVPEPTPAPAIRVEFSESGRSAAAVPGQSLLEIAEEAGVEIPSLCRAGACGTCKSRLLNGDVDFAADLIDPAERNRGWILTCVSYPLSDCRLEA